jgi:hypothetical protein
MSYKGKWRPKNRNKYEGDPTKIVYRSLWERQAFRWCDDNDDIKSWSSESVVVPYRSQVDGKLHRYFVDLKITFNNERTVLVEIKPKRQTKPPEKKKSGRSTRTSRRYLKEAMTYGTNTSKWKYAKAYAEDRGWEFQVWTEDTLRDLGIKILK